MLNEHIMPHITPEEKEMNVVSRVSQSGEREKVKETAVKKPYPNTALSDRKCKKCGKHLKMNLIVKRPDAELCYRCYKRRTA